MKNVDIQQLYFQSGESLLFGVVFCPFIQVSKIGYLICHPFAEEKKNSQKTLVEMASNLANNGLNVFMFDFYGCGDSHGCFSDADLFIWQRNIIDATIFFKQLKQLSEINIVGVRLSAAMTFISADLLDIKSATLIEPISSFITYLGFLMKQSRLRDMVTGGITASNRETLFASLNNQIPIDLDGHVITPKLYQSMIELDKDFQNIDINKSSVDFHLISISNSGRVSKDLYFFHKGYFRDNIPYDTIINEPFWNNVQCFNIVPKLTNSILKKNSSDE